jgi:hypothetical protein
VLGSYSLDYIGRDRRTAALPRGGHRLPPSRAPALGDQSLEFVDGNELRAPRHLDRRD